MNQILRSCDPIGYSHRVAFTARSSPRNFLVYCSCSLDRPSILGSNKSKAQNEILRGAACACVIRNDAGGMAPRNSKARSSGVPTMTVPSWWQHRRPRAWLGSRRPRASGPRGPGRRRRAVVSRSRRPFGR